jgi:hypothetical protein
LTAALHLPPNPDTILRFIRLTLDAPLPSVSMEALHGSAATQAAGAVLRLSL